MIGLALKTFAVIRDTGRIGDDGRIYVLECEQCRDRCSMGASQIRRYQRKGLKPRCQCRSIAATRAKRAARGVSSSSEQITALNRARAARPARAPRRCVECEGMAHRRPKRGCVCGGRYAPEVVVSAVPDMSSSAGWGVL